MAVTEITEITEEQILTEVGYRNKFSVSLILTIAGAVLATVLLSLSTVFGSLAFVFLCFVMLAFYFIGILPLVNACRIKNHVQGGKLRICKDTVVRKKKVGQRNLVFFYEYSGRAEKGMRVSNSVYSSTKKGEDFWLIYIENQPTPIALYPSEKYVFSERLSRQVKNDGTLITPERMLRDAKLKREYIAHSFSMLIGIGITLWPLIQIGELNENVIFSMIFLFVSFGLLFGVFFGIKPLLRAVSISKKIKGGRYSIKEDCLTDKQYRDKNDHRSCLLMFRDYTAKTGKGIFKSDSMYEKVRKGEQFYLVYIDKVQEPILIYPMKLFDV